MFDTPSHNIGLCHNHCTFSMQSVLSYHMNIIISVIVTREVRILIAPWRVLAVVRAAVRALLAGENALSRGQDGSVNTHRRM